MIHYASKWEYKLQIAATFTFDRKSKMFCSRATQLMLLVLTAFSADVSAQELSDTLHNTIPGVPIAYVGENVTFTCITRNSQTIAWTSNDYITSRIELTTVDTIGMSKSSGLASAVLISIDRSTMETVITSQLHVRIVSTYQNSSVTCHSVGTDANKTTTFYIADETSVKCNKPSVCPTEPVTCTCMTGFSTMHSWISYGYIGRNAQLQFASNDNVGTRRLAADPNTFAVLANVSNQKGDIAITSSLTIAAVRSGLPVVVTCVNVDRRNSTVILPIADDCRVSPANVVATTAPGTGSTTCPSDTKFIAPVILLIIVFILFVALLIIFVLMYICLTRKLKEKDEQINNLETQVAEKDKKIKKLQTQAAEKDEQIKDLQAKVIQKDEMIKHLQGKVTEKDEMIAMLVKENGNLTKENEQISESKKTLERQLHKSNKTLEQKLESKEKEINELLKTSVKDNTTIKNLRAEIEALNVKVGRQYHPPAGEGRQNYRGHQY